MPQTTNRSYWPVSGGALSIQPGWFPGHSKAFMYVNIGIPEQGSQAPLNMSHTVVPAFELTGPTNDNYSGQFCIPQIGFPKDVNLTVGQNITLQVVELAQHGAALYSVSTQQVRLDAGADFQQCVDLTLVEDGSPQVEQVTPDNCYNSTDIGFQIVFTTADLKSAATRALHSDPRLLALAAILIISAMFTL